MLICYHCRQSNETTAAAISTAVVIVLDIEKSNLYYILRYYAEACNDDRPSSFEKTSQRCRRCSIRPARESNRRPTAATAMSFTPELTGRSYTVIAYEVTTNYCDNNFFKVVFIGAKQLYRLESGLRKPKRVEETKENNFIGTKN